MAYRGDGFSIVAAVAFAARDARTVEGTNDTAGPWSSLGACLAKFLSQNVSWLLHELVTVPAALQDTWFESAWTVRHLTRRDLG